MTEAIHEIPYESLPYRAQVAFENSQQIPEGYVRKKNHPSGFTGKCSIFKNPIGFPVIFFIIMIIGIIILNMVLISRSPTLRASGVPVHPHLKYSAIILVTEIAILLSIVYVAFLFFFCTYCDHEYNWLPFVLTLFALLVIALLTAGVAGVWLGTGFLWAPVTPKIPADIRIINENTPNNT